MLVDFGMAGGIPISGVSTPGPVRAGESPLGAAQLELAPQAVRPETALSPEDMFAVPRTCCYGFHREQSGRGR